MAVKIYLDSKCFNLKPALSQHASYSIDDERTEQFAFYFEILHES